MVPTDSEVLEHRTAESQTIDVTTKPMSPPRQFTPHPYSDTAYFPSESPAFTSGSTSSMHSPRCDLPVADRSAEPEHEPAAIPVPAALQRRSVPRLERLVNVTVVVSPPTSPTLVVPTDSEVLEHRTAESQTIDVHHEAHVAAETVHAAPILRHRVLPVRIARVHLRQHQRRCTRPLRPPGRRQEC